jgi:hypothetical protein
MDTKSLSERECVAPDFWAKLVKREAFSLKIVPFNMVRRTLAVDIDNV